MGALLIDMSSREFGIQCRVVNQHTTHHPCPEPSLWSRPGFQFPIGATLSNYLDAVSQTQCGYQPPKSGLRDRRELHSSTALPLTFCELGPHLQNESVVQMISKASSSPDILCLLKHPRLGRTPSFTIVSNYRVFRAIRALDQLAG